ncbi:redoxin domain-containing protein [Sediminihabitans luteus]|uniref:redoxin domain-containing protein n=1 Tax=Sediminihabitans luteus TaxID=1138585 RepID=UPI001951BD4F|nr:redoxin domain-containing protein [Sediminihabitans luteus]
MTAAGVVALLALAGCAAQDAPDTAGTAASADQASTATSAPTTPEDQADPATSDSPEPDVVVPAALDFTGTTVAGDAFDAAELAGGPVVLWFWAPWCTICRGEAPAVSDVAADLAGDVTFVGVPGLGQVDAMQGFVDDTGVDGFAHVVDDDGALWQKFGVVSQPSYVLVGADGSTELVVGALGHDALATRAADLVDG